MEWREGKAEGREGEKERETEMKEDLEGRKKEEEEKEEEGHMLGMGRWAQSWLFIFGKEYSACLCL